MIHKQFIHRGIHRLFMDVNMVIPSVRVSVAVQVHGFSKVFFFFLTTDSLTEYCDGCLKKPHADVCIQNLNMDNYGSHLWHHWINMV